MMCWWSTSILATARFGKLAAAAFMGLLSISVICIPVLWFAGQIWFGQTGLGQVCLAWFILIALGLIWSGFILFCSLDFFSFLFVNRMWPPGLCQHILWHFGACYSALGCTVDTKSKCFGFIITALAQALIKVNMNPGPYEARCLGSRETTNTHVIPFITNDCLANVNWTRKLIIQYHLSNTFNCLPMFLEGLFCCFVTVSIKLLIHSWNYTVKKQITNEKNIKLKPLNYD